jgi:hypothetical protein
MATSKKIDLSTVPTRDMLVELESRFNQDSQRVASDLKFTIRAWLEDLSPEVLNYPEKASR